MDKLTDYARAGIEQYWIIDLEPHPRIQAHTLDGASYRLDATVSAGSSLQVDKPFPIVFDPGRLLDPDELW